MLNLSHVLDASVGWEQRIAISQLHDRLPGDRFVQSFSAIHPMAIRGPRFLSSTIVPCPARLGLAFTAAPALHGFFEKRNPAVVHAWGIQAAVAARAAGAKRLVVELFDPIEAVRGVKPLRTLAHPRHFAVVCSSEVVRRRLIEGGLTPEATVVIRPGVDFGRINAVRRGGLRESFGFDSRHFVVLLTQPATREGGHFEVAYALALQSHVETNLGLILPGDSAERDRILRSLHTLPQFPRIHCPQESVPFEDIVVAADVLVVAPRGDASTTAIAWAMAAKTAVIGSAVHSVAELIANKLNGLLFKQTKGKSVTSAITRLLRDRESQAKGKETAHAQAYEVFSVRRYVEQHARLYENLIAGVAPTDGIVDSSRIA